MTRPYFYATLFGYCFAYYSAAGLAINLTYHRCLSHRSLKLWNPLKYILVTAGLPAGAPIQWVGNHRFHHAHTDQLTDPHSPMQDGFWHAHVGWYIGTKNPLLCLLYSLSGPARTLFDSWNRPRTNRDHDHLAADVDSDRFLHFVSRPIPFMFVCWFHTGLFFGIAWLIWGFTGFVFLWITLVVIYNLGDAIDSVAHLSGERPYRSEHFARNNRWLGILTLGEGWHANHHVFPNSARHGLLKGQVDVVWLIIRILEKCRLVSNVRRVNESEIKRKLAEANEYV